MRIAIVAGPYLPVPPLKYGGTEQVIYHLIKGLVEAGHEPVLLGPADSTVECEVVPISRQAIYFPKTTAERMRHDKIAQKIAAATAVKLRQLIHRVDIVHSHGFDLKKFDHFPNLVTLHNPIDFYGLDYLQARKQLFYTAVSYDQKQSCPDLRYAGVIYNGEDPAKFPVVDKPDNYVCFLGRLDRNKSPHLAILLAIKLGLKIKVAGKIDHDGFDYFQQEIRPFLSHPLVEWLGELGETEKIAMIAKAKCNLHPTNFREPFGLTVIEAAYCGTPTIAVNRGAMPELIENKKTGILVEDFAEAFDQLKTCFDMDRRLVARRARAQFNYKKMTKEYLKTYQYVLGQF